MNLIDLLRGQMLGRTPGINPNEPTPGIPSTPSAQTDPRWMQGLNSPLGQIGLRMLAGSRDARGNPVGLGNAAGGAVLGYQQDQAGQVQADLQRRYMEMQIKKMGMPDQNSSPSSVQEYEYAKRNGFAGTFEEWRRSAKPADIQSVEWYESATPEQRRIYDMQNRRENSPYFQWRTRTLPDGSTQEGTFDARTGQTNWTQQVVPGGKKQEVEAAGGTRGKAKVEAELDLPRVRANAEQAIAAIDGLLKSPGAPGVFGITGKLPIIPGTARADAKTFLDQVQGKTFLEAYNTLKGGGQITEIEGAKAEAAIARLNTAQSWDAAQTALKELKGVIASGVERAKLKAGVPGDSGSASGPSVGSVEGGYRFKGGNPADPNSWERVQ